MDRCIWSAVLILERSARSVWGGPRRSDHSDPSGVLERDSLNVNENLSCGHVAPRSQSTQANEAHTPGKRNQPNATNQSSSDLMYGNFYRFNLGGYMKDLLGKNF